MANPQPNEGPPKNLIYGLGFWGAAGFVLFKAWKKVDRGAASWELLRFEVIAAGVMVLLGGIFLLRALGNRPETPPR